MKITYDENFIYCSDEAPVDRPVLEYHFNAVYSKAKKHWRLPANLWAARELMKEFPDLKTSESFVAYGKTLRSQVDQMLEVRKAVRVSANSPLRPYQLQDVHVLTGLPQAGIFNEPRTGKTPTTITLMRELGTSRNLIVSPASLIYNWESEIKKWYPEAEVSVVSGTFVKRTKIYEKFKSSSHAAKVLIISKDTLKYDADGYDLFSEKFDLIAVDEAHYMRNWKTKQSEAVFGLKADRKYALTGTPTVKHAADIYGILKFLQPKKYTSYWQFVDRYFGSGKNYMGHMKENDKVKPHRAEELKSIVGLISVARKRKEVMQWLPDKQRITIPVEMSTKQKKMYDQMKEYFMTDEGLDAQNQLVQMIRLRQILLDPRLLDTDVKGAKTEAILEWLDDNREPVVIMSMFTSYLKLLKPEIEKLGLKVGMIHGEMSNKEKQEAATHFQEGRSDILLCNIISAGTGFTLDKSETIIFTDKAWNPADNDQAEDRITPTTEEKNHKHAIISFEVRNSMDARINELLSTKKSLTDIINEGGREAIRKLLMG
jgi:SNF2 family DNA or RNA helicase